MRFIPESIWWFPERHLYEHHHKNCKGWDHDEPDYCCTFCGCCPCYSWRCRECLYNKPIMRWLDKFVWHKPLRDAHGNILPESRD